VHHGFHAAVQGVNLGQGFDGLAKIGEVDLGEPAAFLSWPRRVDVEHFVVVPEELLHTRAAHLAAAAGYNYAFHLILWCFATFNF
jgi:hypothetical protein